MRDWLQKLATAAVGSVMAAQVILPRVGGAAFRALLLAFFFRYLFAFCNEASFLWRFAGSVLWVTSITMAAVLLVVCFVTLFAEWGKPQDRIAGLLPLVLITIMPIIFVGAVANWSDYQFHDWLLRSSGKWTREFVEQVFK